MAGSHVHILSLLQTLHQVKGPATIELHACHWMPGSSVGPVSDGVVKIGERVRVVGQSPSTGYPHLFNLGTDGSCLKLAPSDRFPVARVVAGQSFEIPRPGENNTGEMDVSFPVTGPPSALNGQPDRLLIIITDKPMELNLADLNGNLSPRSVPFRGHTSSRENLRGPRYETPGLFSLPPSQWAYGRLDLQVE